MRDSSTVITQSLPTFFIASALIVPICESEFAEIGRPLEELPGRRLGAIGLALKKLASVCSEWAEAADARTQQIAVKAQQAKSDVQSAHDVCQAGSGTFSFFGGRSGRSMRYFLDQIRAFARIRLQEDLADATAKFYRALRVRIEDQMRGATTTIGTVDRSKLSHSSGQQPRRRRTTTSCQR